MNTYNHQRGSAIIWIFIMIALFAGLSFAISDGSKTGEGMIGSEQADLAATEIIDYASAIKRTVQELQINGCSDEEIDFSNNVYKQENGTDTHPIGSNLSAPADGSCGIFHPNGGALRPVTFKSPESTPTGATVQSGHAGLASRDILGIGNDGEIDISMSILGIDQNVCIKLNKLVGVENPNGLPPTETAMAIIGDEASELVGKQVFCYLRGGANPRHVFHQVIIAK